MESTLAAAYADLTGDVGHFLGYGRGSDNGDTAWTTAQAADVARAVKGGMRKFYFCDYDWSFLRPMATLTLVDGTVTVTLPDDFGGIEGKVIVSSSGDSIGYTLDVGGIGAVYHAATLDPDAVGQPELMCVEPLKGTTHLAGQRSQLRFFPTPDQDYTIQATYYLNPNYLTGSLPYAYGGPQHAETLLEACLSVAELIKDDTVGIHAFEFDKRLQISKDIDRRNKPQHMGYNLDRSDCRQGMTRGSVYQPVVTFNGVEYS